MNSFAPDDRIMFAEPVAREILARAAALDAVDGAAYRSLENRWYGNLTRFAKEAVLVLGSFTLSLTAVGGTDATVPGLLWSAACGIAGAGIASIGNRPCK